MLWRDQKRSENALHLLSLYFFKKIISSTGHISHKLTIDNDNQESFYQFLSFTTPPPPLPKDRPGVLVLGHDHISYKVNMHYFVEYFLYCRAKIRQAEYMYVVMMSQGGSSNSVHFMTPSAGFIVLGRGLVSHVHVLML